MSKKFLQALSLSCAIICIGSNAPSYGAAAKEVSVVFDVLPRPSGINFPVEVQFTTSTGEYWFRGSSNSRTPDIPYVPLPSAAYIGEVRMIKPSHQPCTMNFKPGTPYSALQVTLTAEGKCIVDSLEM